MAAEMVVAPSTDIQAQVWQFYKFISAALRVLKEDLPAKLTDKLDRMINELLRV